VFSVRYELSLYLEFRIIMALKMSVRYTCLLFSNAMQFFPAAEVVEVLNGYWVLDCGWKQVQTPPDLRSFNLRNFRPKQFFKQN